MYGLTQRVNTSGFSSLGSRATEDGLYVSSFQIRVNPCHPWLKNLLSFSKPQPFLAWRTLRLGGLAFSVARGFPEILHGP